MRAPDQHCQSRTQFKERRLFEAMYGHNRNELSHTAVMDGLSHALCSDNDAVKRKAAVELSRLQLTKSQRLLRVVRELTE